MTAGSLSGPAAEGAATAFSNTAPENVCADIPGNILLLRALSSLFIPGCPNRRHAIQSSLFCARNLDIRSAICTLLRSEKGKWVFPRMPISGRCTTVTSPP